MWPEENLSHTSGPRTSDSSSPSPTPPHTPGYTLYINVYKEPSYIFKYFWRISGGSSICSPCDSPVLDFFTFGSAGAACACSMLRHTRRALCVSFPKRENPPTLGQYFTFPALLALLNLRELEVSSAVSKAKQVFITPAERELLLVSKLSKCSALITP